MNILHEGAELTGESGSNYMVVSALGQSNVWTGVKVDGDSKTVVCLKAPSPDDDREWSQFQHEMTMHELLKDCTYIRKVIDRIPSAPPILVLEILETTLWSARTKRPFSKMEIRKVAKCIAEGLMEVHKRGLVYVDLKMQNVLLNGFDPSHEGDGSQLTVKLGDLGIVMEPTKGKAQPVTYRAPEVFFKGELEQPVDTWACGIITSHLLEARTRFNKTGIYDDLDVGGGTMLEREQAMRSALANDYDIEHEAYYQDVATPYQHPDHPAGAQFEELRKRGLDVHDVEFLRWMLQVDPTKRPSAGEVAGAAYLLRPETRQGPVDASSNDDNNDDQPTVENPATSSPQEQQQQPDSGDTNHSESRPNSPATVQPTPATLDGINELSPSTSPIAANRTSGTSDFWAQFPGITKKPGMEPRSEEQEAPGVADEAQVVGETEGEGAQEQIRKAAEGLEEKDGEQTRRDSSKGGTFLSYS